MTCEIINSNINNFNRKSTENASHFCHLRKCLGFLYYFLLEMVYVIVNELWTVFHFLALYFESTVLSQSELRNVFMYIIIIFD